MDLERIVAAKSGFATKKMGEALVLVPLKNNVADLNAMFTLNDVGAFIWESIEPEVSKQYLSNSLIEEFDIDSETATKDLDEFLTQIEQMINE